MDVEQWHKHLKDVAVSINERPRVVTFNHPGIPFWTCETYDDVPGLIHLINVCFDCMTFANFHYNSGRKLEPGDQLLVFRTESEIKISRAMYERSMPKWPVVAKFCKGKRAGPFQTRKIEVSTQDNKHLLMSETITLVFVDATTRKPTRSIPEWLRAEDGSEAMPTGLRLERLKKRPLDAYCQKHVILLSDVDMNNHANYLVYIIKCYNSLLHAITAKEQFSSSRAQLAQNQRENGSGKACGDQTVVKQTTTTGCDSHKNTFPEYLTWNIMRQGLKTVRSKFIKECLLGDELCVYAWQEEGKPLWVFFSIEHDSSKGSGVAFEMAVEYHGPSSCL